MGLSHEQKQMRLTGISGSELSAVCGLNPWASAVNVWENKLSLNQTDISLNSAIIRGTLFESPVLAWYTLLTGRTVTQQPTIRHPNFPLIMATPDGIATKEGEPDICVEVKCPGFQTQRHWSDPADDPEGIPEYVLPQVIAQMAVTGLRMCDVVMFTGIEPRIYHVPYNDELFQALREIAEKFWRDYVLTRKPPPPDSSPMYAEFLARYTPQTEDRKILDLTSNPEAAFWANQLLVAKSQVKEAESIEEKAKNELKRLVGNHAYAKIPGATVTWKNSKAKTLVNWPAVVKEAKIEAEIVAKHTSLAKTPRPFKITFDKEKS